MRADRLVSLLMLLQHRGKLTAAQIAAELEVSERTVLRDIEALSTSGVPVYAERGRAGGFRLLPGFRTDLTGLTLDEARAVLAAAPGQIASPAFSSAMRKVAAALPDSYRSEAAHAAQRILIDPDGFLREADVSEHLAALQEAVFTGCRLNIDYSAARGRHGLRTVDPVGLVHAAGVWYLLALRSGQERVYRASRIRSAEVLQEPAQRPDDVDLTDSWQRHRAEFRATLTKVTVRAKVEAWAAARLRAVADVVEEHTDEHGIVSITVRFGHLTHAEHVLWGVRADVQEPVELRDTLRTAARSLANGY